MSDRWDDLREWVEHDDEFPVMFSKSTVADLLAERAALASEVERLRAVLDDIAVHPLDGERAWRLAAAALTEENRDG